MYTSPLIKETTTNFQNWIIYGKKVSYRMSSVTHFFFTHILPLINDFLSLSPSNAGVPQVTWSRRTPLVKSACTRSVPAVHVTGGTCVAQSPSKFTCHCPEGYRGPHCEVTLAIYRDDVGLSFSSLFAICICFMALLGIYLQHVLLKKKNHLLTFIMLPTWFEMNPLFLSNWFTYVILWAYI